MSNWLVCGALAVLPLWGGGQPEPPIPTALYFQFQNEPSGAVVEAVQEEVETIMAPMGADFTWRRLDQVTGSEISSQLAVVKFLGRCEPAAKWTTHALKQGALGWTHVSDGAILPFTDIDCDGIREFLQFGLGAISTKERDQVYGRALGRVLAHELYHIFANTAHHGSNGVAKGVYSVRDLLSHDFHFEERESDALRNNRPHTVTETVNATR